MSEPRRKPRLEDEIQRARALREMYVEQVERLDALLAQYEAITREIKSGGAR